MRVTGGVHEREIFGETLAGKAQVESGAATSARREPGCVGPRDGSAGGGVVELVQRVIGGGRAGLKSRAGDLKVAAL